MRLCTSCEHELPTDAVYCPACGIATPTEISLGTGEIRGPEPSNMPDSEHRERLQQAIGAGYELRALLGRGGFGEVYAAWDTGLQREVAIKALRHDVFATEALLERFKREARAVAKLRHPNIIPIYVVGEDEGLAYMIMPKIQGEDLRAVLQREHTLSLDESRRILGEVASALSTAHKAGIVHRDIKPENVLLEGDERHVYVMDFGIAKALGSEEEGLTGTGMIVGTPSYMSPEQASGQGTVDARTDVYSLGVMGYQMLTGRLPIEANSLADLIYQQVTGDIQPITIHRKDLPADLVTIISRSLERDPNDRWTSAEELLGVLEGRIAQPSAHRRRRSRWPVLIGGTAAVAAVAVIAAIVIPGRSTPEPATENAASQAVTSAPASEPAAPDTQPTQVSPPPDPQRQAGEPVSTPRQAVVQPPAPAAPVAQVGYLTLNARPYGMVAIDGVDLRITPVTRHELPPGEYVVTVSRDGHRVWRETVTITVGNEERRAIVLVPEP